MTLTVRPLDDAKLARLWSGWRLLADTHPSLCDQVPTNTSHNEAWEAATAGHTLWSGFTPLPEENGMSCVSVPQVSFILGWFYSVSFSLIKFH